jgi:hypothetical protein
MARVRDPAAAARPATPLRGGRGSCPVSTWGRDDSLPVRARSDGDRSRDPDAGGPGPDAFSPKPGAESTRSWATIVWRQLERSGAKCGPKPTGTSRKLTVRRRAAPRADPRQQIGVRSPRGARVVLAGVTTRRPHCRNASAAGDSLELDEARRTGYCPPRLSRHAHVCLGIGRSLSLPSTAHDPWARDRRASSSELAERPWRARGATIGARGRMSAASLGFADADRWRFGQGGPSAG